MAKRWQHLLIAFALLAVAVFLFHTALPSFIGGLILAYLLFPLCEIFSKKMPRSAAILLVYLLLLVILFLITYLVLPQLSQELVKLGESLPAYMQHFTMWLANFQDAYAKLQLPAGVENAINDCLIGLEAKIAAFIGNILSLIPSFISNIISLVLVPVIAFYFLRDRELINRRLKALLPPGIRQSLGELWQEIDRLLRQFIRGYCTVAFLVGFLFFLAMALVGMDYALVFGVIMGFGELIPYFGPFLGVLAPLFLAALQGWGMFLKVLIAFFVVQQLENVILTPKIMGESVGLHPLAVILAVLVGGYWLGFAGLILGVPILAVATLVTVWAYRKVAAGK